MTTRDHHVEASWQPVDSRRIMSSRDQADVTLFAEALMDLDRLLLELPALLHLMRDHAAGQPRAQRFGPSAGASHDGEDPGAVDGEVATGHHDPAGDAASGPDGAARDHRNLMRCLTNIADMGLRARGIANGYPAQHARQAELPPTPGKDWCTACFKDGHYLQPIALKPDGVPRYKGLCGWCGAFKSANGFEPPTDLLHAKHRGERISEAMVATARAEWKRLHPEAKKKTKGGKKRRKAASTEGDEAAT